MDRFEDQVKKRFAQRLRRARIEAGFRSATAFANALKVQSGRYRYWERGQAMPDISTMTRICLLLDITPNDLLPLALEKNRSRDDHPPGHNPLHSKRAA